MKINLNANSIGNVYNADQINIGAGFQQVGPDVQTLPMSPALEGLREAVAKGDLKSAVEGLVVATANGQFAQYRSDADLCAARYHELERAQQRGIIGAEDYYLQFNRLVGALSATIGNMAAEG